MGNHVSKVPVDYIFAADLPPPVAADKPFIVRLEVPNIFDAKSEGFEKYFVLSPGHLQVTSVAPDDTPNFLWRPQSRQRDFEVYDAFSEKERRLAQGQIVGVLVVECCRAYLKVVWEDVSKFDGHPLGEPVFSTWDHSDKAKEIMKDDLGLGLDVTCIRGKAENFVVDRLHNWDDEDEPPSETIIFAPGVDKNLSSFAKQVKDMLERSDEADEDAKKRTN